MGYRLTTGQMDAVMAGWGKSCRIWAPVRIPEGGPYSDADVVRYGTATKSSEIVLDAKSRDSFKDALLPLSQTLFFFTEDAVKEADTPDKAPGGTIVFLRSCDLHAVRRLDAIFRGAPGDYYYERLREKMKFVVVGCREAFESCFCVDMGTNRPDGYDAALDFRDGAFYVDNRNPAWEEFFSANGETVEEPRIPFVSETPTRVTIPGTLPPDVADLKLWDEYDSRCIDCGRCTFVCPTCTCFTTQDVFYTDNGRVGERRRVQASCMVDGYTDVAGGGAYRKKNGQRIRFKNLHKIHDYKKRFGTHMCVGCGRCDDVCPEYISFSGSIGRLAAIREGGEAR